MTPRKPNKAIKITIVIVDDSPDEHVFIKRALKDYKNILFNDYYNGEDFLHFLEQSKHTLTSAKHPDIVILDVNMPKMDGFEVFNRIERKGLKDDIKFHILTTAITDHEKSNCKKYGLSCYQKPFNLDDFRNLLEEMIENARRH